MPRPIKNQPLNICFKLSNKCLEHCRRKMLVLDYDLICFSHFIVFCQRHEAATSHCCLTLHLSVFCVGSCISYYVFMYLFGIAQQCSVVYCSVEQNSKAQWTDVQWNTVQSCKPVACGQDGLGLEV